MNPEFKYFDWAIPLEGQPVFALYDVFDQHFMIQSRNYDRMEQVRDFIKSKTALEIVKLESAATNNSDIESWKITNVDHVLYGDIMRIYRDDTNWSLQKKPQEIIEHPELAHNNTTFDSFKLDLQRQIFFINYCLELLHRYLHHDPVAIKQVEDFILSAIEQSTSYEDTVEKVLNFDQITDKHSMISMIRFLRVTGLFYE